MTPNSSAIQSEIDHLHRAITTIRQEIRGKEAILRLATEVERQEDKVEAFRQDAEETDADYYRLKTVNAFVTRALACANYLSAEARLQVLRRWEDDLHDAIAFGMSTPTSLPPIEERAA